RAVPAPRARQPPQAGLLTTSPTSETRFEVARDRFDTGGVAFGASLIHIFWISSRFSCSCCPRRASIKLIVVSAMLCALCAPKHSIDGTGLRSRKERHHGLSLSETNALNWWCSPPRTGIARVRPTV